MPSMPPTPAAWTLSLAGLALLLLSVWLQAPMWLVATGQRVVAPGGGEYMVALFGGLPTLLGAIALLGVAALRRAWRSWVSSGAFALSLVLLAGWVALVGLDLRG